MSAPAGGAGAERLCAMTDCDFAAILWVARAIPPNGAANATFTAKPMRSVFHTGVPLCVDHAHEALDYMISTVLIPPGDPAKRPEQTGSPS